MGTIGPSLGRLCLPDGWRRADNPYMSTGRQSCVGAAPFLGGRRLSSLHSCYPTCADRSRAPVPSSEQVEYRMPNDAPAACAALFEELADIVFGHPIDAGVDDLWRWPAVVEREQRVHRLLAHLERTLSHERGDIALFEELQLGG